MIRSHHRCLTVQGPGIPMEAEAIAQLESIAGRTGCLAAIGMPDLHAGPGVPIGACFAFETLHPALVGSDAGCGVRVTTIRSKFQGDALERRIRDAFAEPLFCHELLVEVGETAWREGIRGLSKIAGLPDSLRTLATNEPKSTILPTPKVPPTSLLGVGTIGGGNHFAEVSRIGSVEDGATASAMALKQGGTAIVVHSGSRGVGADIVHRWRDTIPQGTEAEAYLAELAGAIRFAQANRFLLTWRLLVAAGAGRLTRIRHSFDVVHNTAVGIELHEKRLWLHRKGCAPAEDGEATIILGSRGAPSWIMRGCGNASTLCSVAHGAGRRLSRSDARKRFKASTTREQLRRTDLGGRVLCDDPKLLFEEHPSAYKPIEPVIAATEQQGMATRVASLFPMITVKQ